MSDESTTLHSGNYKRVAFWLFAFVITGFIIGSGIILFVLRSSSPLPKAIIKNVGFPLYYPSNLPPGYSYKKESAKNENGVIFYSLQSAGNASVIVSEQSVPKNPPDISRLIGFTSIQTLAGSASVGTNNKHQPTAIIVSNTTLIIITGAKTVPSDIVTILAKAMVSLPQ